MYERVRTQEHEVESNKNEYPGIERYSNVCSNQSFFLINLTIKIILLHREGIISIYGRTDIEPEKIWAQKTVCIATQSSFVLVRNQVRT